MYSQYDVHQNPMFHYTDLVLTTFRLASATKGWGIWGSGMRAGFYGPGFRLQRLMA